MTYCDYKNTLVLDHIHLADAIAGRKRNKQVSYDELRSAAYLGLVEAANRYDPSAGGFPAFASVRIAGAVKDYFRELRWGTRNRPLTNEAHDGWDVPAVPEGKSELGRRIAGNLTSQQKHAVFLYYFDGQKIRDIAAGMGVHETRVSQLLSESRAKLQHEWAGREDELWDEVA